MQTPAYRLPRVPHRKIVAAVGGGDRQYYAPGGELW
jgi:hypothetical protein